MSINLTPDPRRIDGKYIVTVMWYHGDLWVPYGTQHFIFETQEEAFRFARDKDCSLRKRTEFNWLYQGYRFWVARILVFIAEPGGYVKNGWQLFTLSDEEVAKECVARELDVERCIADRDALRESRNSNILAVWKD